MTEEHSATPPLRGIARSIDALFSDSEEPRAPHGGEDAPSELSPPVEATGTEAVEHDPAATDDIAWVAESGVDPTPDMSENAPGHDQLMREVATFLRAEPEERPERVPRLRRAFHDARSRSAGRAMMEAVEALAQAGMRDEVSAELARELLNPGVAGALAMRLVQAVGDESSRADLTTLVSRLGPTMAEALGEELDTAKDRSVRRVLVEAIVALGADARPVLERMVEDDNWYVVRNAVTILGQVGDEAGVEHLTGTLAHENPTVRRETVTALSRIGGENAAFLVVGKLEDTDPTVRAAAARAVGILGVERALRRLIEMLESESEEDVVVEVARALGQLGDPSAVNALEKRAVGSFFGRPPAAIRVAAYQGLAGMATPRAKQLLDEALEDKDAEVRAAVRAALRARQG